MAITYGFYDSNETRPRIYHATDFGSMFDGVVNDGIFTTIYNRFNLTYGGRNDDGYDYFIVDTGKAWFNRTWITNDSSYTVTCGARQSGRSRRDAIAIKIDQTAGGRTNSIVVLSGGTIPSETDIYYYPMYYVTIPELSLDTQNPSIEDNRGSNECPWSGLSGQITPIEEGGTGANTVAGARTNLGITPSNIGAAHALHTHSPDDILGMLDAAQVPNLSASKITSGTLSFDRLDIMPLSKGGTGVSASSLDNLLTLIGAAKANNTYTIAQVDQLIADVAAGDVPAGDITGTVAIAHGGTGATTAAGALANIGAAAASHTHAASAINSGTFDAGRIPSLDASKIGSGTLADARIPSLAASKITSGTFDSGRIPSLAASKITSGTFDAGRIPSLDASKIGSGTLPAARGGTGATTLSGALDGMLSAGRMKLSSYQYGSSFPSSPVAGQIFFKAL